MRDILVSLILFGAIPFILYRPHIGVLVWSWISYMNPHRLTYGFAYNMPFAAITAGALVLGMIFNREQKRLPITPVTVIWLLFVFWMVITTMFAFSEVLAQEELKRVLKIQFVTFVTLMVMGKRERLHQLVWVMALSIAFFGIKGGIFTILTGGDYIVWGPPGSFIEGNNELALALIIVLPLMWYLAMNTTYRWIKYLLVVFMLLIVLSIIASYSRGAFLAAGAMGIMFLFKSKYKLRIAIALVLVSVVVVSFMPEKWKDRMSTISTYEEDKSAMGRINAWHFSFNLAKDKPLVGGGFRTFRPYLFQIYAPNPDDFHDAHSIYFEVLAEQGFVGLFLFLLLWFLTFRTGSRIIIACKDRDDLKWAGDLARMVQVGLVGYWAGGAFLGLAYFDLPYHLMSIIVLTKMIVSKEIKNQNINGVENPDERAS